MSLMECVKPFMSLINVSNPQLFPYVRRFSVVIRTRQSIPLLQDLFHGFFVGFVSAKAVHPYMYSNILLLQVLG